MKHHHCQFKNKSLGDVHTGLVQRFIMTVNDRNYKEKHLRSESNKTKHKQFLRAVHFDLIYSLTE